jgi:Meckel syndrome type 1 protein
MTASALNSASIAAKAVGPAGGGPVPPTAAGAAAGFDALLATLFPQAAPVAPTEGAGAPQTAPLFPPAPDVEDAPVEDTAVADPAAESDADGDTAAALAAALAAPLAEQASAAAPSSEGAPAEPTAKSPPAWGRDKAKGVPAQPALANANPKADLLGKAEAGQETTDEPAAPPAPQAPAAPAQGAAAAARAAQPAAPPSAAPATPPTPLTPGQLDAAPPPPADAAAPEAAAAPTEANAPPAVAAETVTAPPPAPPQPARPSRTERARAAAEAEGRTEAAPVDPTDKPAQGKPVEATGKAGAASDETRAPTRADGEGEAATDAPDAAAQPAEARAPAQSAAPAAHAQHGVRGSPETVAHLAAGIAKKLEGQSTRFDLELNPQGLGKVDVRVEIGAHGQLTAALLFDNAQAAQELRSRATELQRALEQAGFDVAGGLTFDVADQGRQQGQAWQDQGDTRANFRGQAFRAALENAGDAADAAALGALRLRRGVTAGLDLRI